DQIIGRGAAGELPARPRHHRRDRRDAPRVGQLADRERRIGIERDDEIALLAKDELAADYAGAVRVGLVVLDDDLDRVGLAADLEPVLHGRADALDHPRCRLAEVRADAGLGTDETDLEGSRLGTRDVDVQGPGSGGEPGDAAGFEKRSPADRALASGQFVASLYHGDLLHWSPSSLVSIHARIPGASPEGWCRRRPPDPWRGV